MDNANISYSLKNIPLPTQSAYMNALVPKVTSFIQRLRFRTYYYLESLKKKNENDSEDDEEEEGERKEYYGFGTTKSAPNIPALSAFENDLYSLISNLTFRKDKNSFQTKLLDDVDTINKSADAFVLADKTNNVYRVSADTYKKLLTENITTHYKKDIEQTESKINHNAKVICDRLNMSDRVQRIPPKQAFITIKDHKDDFKNNTKCRLINPMKSEIGRISKIKLQSINKDLRLQLQLNQWINTDDVLNWFGNIQQKSRQSFLNFDIEEFYPSITERLFKDALDFAALHTVIPEEDRQIFMNARDSLLHSRGVNWVKRTGLFDTTMGAYDGAECCELIGLYMLSLLKANYPQINMGLYRDDGLGTHRRIPGAELERTKKGIVDLFKDKGLKIIVKTGLKEVDFLDVNLNLSTGEFKPYNKPNNTPTYLNVSSNHPPNIIKSIPDTISSRLNKLSSNKNDFDSAKTEYEEALKKSGYKDSSKLTFKPKQNNSTRKRPNRKRKITWFNPPFAANLKTDLGRKFLNLIDRHFPKNSPLSKLLNRHTVKLSYSCMPNMRSIILKHNNKLLKEIQPPTPAGCNCRKPQSCPLQGNCLARCLVYEAKILHNGKEIKYHGSTSNAFKERYRNHTSSFRNERFSKATALAAFVWSNKLNPEPEISWRIVGQRQPVTPGGTCGVCTLEKLTIMKNRGPDTLNQRSEIYLKCPHRDKNSVRHC